MTSDQIKKKIAKKRQQIALLEMQLTGAALKAFGQAVAECVNKQVQPKQFPNGGIHAGGYPKDHVEDNEEVIVNPEQGEGKDAYFYTNQTGGIKSKPPVITDLDRLSLRVAELELRMGSLSKHVPCNKL